MIERGSATESAMESTMKGAHGLFVGMYKRTTNCSSDSSKSSLLTPTPPGCSAGESGFLTTIDDGRVRMYARIFSRARTNHIPRRG